MRKRTAALGLAAALSLTPVVAAPAEAHVPAHRPAVVAETPAPTQNNNDNHGNKGLNGLWGLLGLAGLLGLIPRRRKEQHQQPAQAPRVSETGRTQEYQSGGATRRP